MSFAPLSPLGLASRAAFRAEARAGMKGEVALLCFLVCTVMLGTLIYIGAQEWLKQADSSPSR